MKTFYAHIFNTSNSYHALDLYSVINTRHTNTNMVQPNVKNGSRQYIYIRVLLKARSEVAEGKTVD